MEQADLHQVWQTHLSVKIIKQRHNFTTEHKTVTNNLSFDIKGNNNFEKMPTISIKYDNDKYLSNKPKHCSSTHPCDSC